MNSTICLAFFFPMAKPFNHGQESEQEDLPRRRKKGRRRWKRGFEWFLIGGLEQFLMVNTG